MPSAALQSLLKLINEQESNAVFSRIGFIQLIKGLNNNGNWTIEKESEIRYNIHLTSDQDFFKVRELFSKKYFSDDEIVLSLKSPSNETNLVLWLMCGKQVRLELGFDYLVL